MTRTPLAAVDLYCTRLFQPRFYHSQEGVAGFCSPALILELWWESQFSVRCITVRTDPSEGYWVHQHEGTDGRQTEPSPCCQTIHRHDGNRGSRPMATVNTTAIQTTRSANEASTILPGIRTSSVCRPGKLGADFGRLTFWFFPRRQKPAPHPWCRVHRDESSTRRPEV